MTTSASITETLERIRIAADNINQADTDEARARVNAWSKNEILESAENLLEISDMIGNIYSAAERINPHIQPSPACNPNEEQQGDILLNLEKLAFLIGQGKWAESHGFQDMKGV